MPYVLGDIARVRRRCADTTLVLIQHKPQLLFWSHWKLGQAHMERKVRSDTDDLDRSWTTYTTKTRHWGFGEPKHWPVLLYAWYSTSATWSKVRVVPCIRNQYKVRQCKRHRSRWNAGENTQNAAFCIAVKRVLSSGLSKLILPAYFCTRSEHLELHRFPFLNLNNLPDLVTGV